ncbi:MAG: DUF885 domain-containing protein [Bacteroidota bacterium]|nr:DUF885 domain-containing protein [Bacteroidota bacterium]
MKKIFLLLTVLILVSRIFFPAKGNCIDTDSDFELLMNNFIEEYLGWNPQSAVYLGLHQYDGKLTDYSLESVNSQIKWAENYLNKLSETDPITLSKINYTNYKILLSEIQKTVFALKDKNSYRTNPMLYAGVIDVNIYISRDFAPIEDRVRSIIAIEKESPKIFAAARNNLNESLPKPFIEIAIKQAKGGADFLGKDLVEALKEVNNDVLMSEFYTVNNAAIKELNDYAEYLEKEKLPKANNNYSIGKDLYVKMLEQEMISMSPEEILAYGMNKLKQEQKLFEETAFIIDPSKKAIDVFKDIQKDHPTAESLIPDTKKNTEAIRQFLIDKNIITIPSEVRVLVKETPQYARATSFASMDTPGPFEKSLQAYYYVTPVESNWSDTQKDEWLSAFNYYTTDVVTIHEAYPGHYVQFLHLNASDVSKLQKILGSYPFSEGWAHYTEQMLIEEGFGTDKDKITAAKYKLAQLDESLLRYCRLCVSIMMHTQGMTVEEGTKFFMDNCYYEEKPANSEAIRGTYDPGYLYYTLGKLMLLKLRENYKIQEGENYSLKKFHDEVLNYGSPPIPLLREIILKDQNSWKEIL